MFCLIRRRRLSPDLPAHAASITAILPAVVGAVFYDPPMTDSPRDSDACNQCPPPANRDADGEGTVRGDHPALRVVMMPRDTNQYGTIFGGVILSYIDQAAFIEARRQGSHRWVTVSVDRVDFVAPVLVGDVVIFRTSLARAGTTSITARICVEAERFTTGEQVHVTEALLTMVAVDSNGNPIPFRSESTVGPSGALIGYQQDASEE